MKNDHIVKTIEGRVGYLTLNRPEVLNAISYEMMCMLEEGLSAFSMRKDLCAVAIKASGRAFCVGADLKFLLSVLDKPHEIEVYIDQINKTFNAIEDCPLPVVAAVQDFALAGGFEMLLACDLVVVSETARLGDQHANYWLVPGGGGSQRLGYLVGPQRAKELLLTGRWLNGKEAEAWGLASKAVPGEELGACLEGVLKEIVQKSPETIKSIKDLANYNLKPGIRKSLNFERAIFFPYLQTDSAREGLRAFAEKRKPEFENIKL